MTMAEHIPFVAEVSTSCRERGMFEGAAPSAKRQATANPEYQQAFRRFDTDGSGTIDLNELNSALQAVEQSVEGGTPQALFPHPFDPTTLIWLAAKYAAKGGGVIGHHEFCEMMQYLEVLKNIFGQIDADRSGNISVAELSRALSLSGFNVTGFPGGGDALSLMVAKKIGSAYDLDGNGVLTFDEFLQMRLEWDSYLKAWSSEVPPGAEGIAPQQLVEVLEAIKRTVEPVSVLATYPVAANLSGFCPQSFLGPMYYTSMCCSPQPFLESTVVRLIQKFGCGSVVLNFEQFCMMMEWLKEQKKKFVVADTSCSGNINVLELSAAFAKSGMPLPSDQLLAIAGRYDITGSGNLGFDEFLQLMTDINPNE
jgi:Ca2+-binding EF-hand superfamily protein